MQQQMDDIIKDIEKFKENLKKAGEIKEGDDPSKIPNDIKENAGYILYDKIADTTIEILQQPSVLEPLNKISEKLGDDLTAEFIQVLALTMTHSAYAAIVNYDDLLKVELSAQFNHMVDGINRIAADNNAYKGVLEVYQKRFDEDEKRLVKLELKQ